MATSSYTYSTGTTNFNITFDYLRDTHVIVQVGSTQYDINDNYFTINTTPTPKVVLTTPVAEGTVVKIMRKSLGKNNDQAFLVDFNDGSVLTEKEQDESYRHNYYLNQESLEGNLTITTPTLDSDPSNKSYVDAQVIASGAGTVTSVIAGNGLSGGTITSTGTVSIPTSGGDLNISGGKVGIAGDASASYSAKITGDLLIEDNHTTGVNAHLTLENTHGTDGAAIFLAKAAGGAIIQLNDSNTTGTDDAKYNLTSSAGVFAVDSIDDDDAGSRRLLSLFPTGNVKLDSLPTSDPSTTGYLWNDGGVVSVSGSSGFSGGGGSSWTSSNTTPTGGNDGDFHLNTSNNDVYKKANGSWAVEASIPTDASASGIQAKCVMTYDGISTVTVSNAENISSVSWSGYNNEYTVNFTNNISTFPNIQATAREAGGPVYVYYSDVTTSSIKLAPQISGSNIDYAQISLVIF